MKSSAYLTSLRLCVAAAITICMAATTYGQITQIAHFVSPSYPPLARQAGITGQVTVTGTINKDGSVSNMSASESAHPLLADWTKKSVAEWKFEPKNYESRLVVTFYYGYSGDTRESNPNTTVKVDFHDLNIRVYLITDAPSFVHQ